MPPQTHIKPGQRIGFVLSTRERDLILERTFLDPGIESRLRVAELTNGTLVVPLTLDDIDDLAGCIAAEANHCDEPAIRRALDALHDRLSALEDRFTDVPAVVVPPRSSEEIARSTFTARQGQYLAFIYYYTKIHGVPPAEADLQRFFRVSPPTIHQMILTLEARGLIERTAGKARSIRLRLSRAELPDLE